jgi:hypothetical protein
VAARTNVRVLRLQFFFAHATGEGTERRDAGGERKDKADFTIARTVWKGGLAKIA